MKQCFALLLLILGCGLFSRGLAQNPGRDSSAVIKKDSTAIIDSLMKDFEAMVDELVAPKSFFSIGAAVGNRSFSVKNNSLNTQEATTDRLSVTPYVGYYHKSGLGLTLMGYSTSFPDNTVGMYQYAVTPSYDYVGRHVSAGVSYSRYFGKDTALQSTSPYANDAYAYVNLIHKSWRYGLSLGFANGNLSDHVHYQDTVYRFSTILQRLVPVVYDVSVSANEKIRDYSVSASVRKDFKWDNVLKKGDNLTFSILGYVVAGASKMHVTANSNVNLNVRKITLQRFRKTYQNANGNGFQLQSTALCLNLYYMIGKFNISPVWFLDYYFPDASRKFSQVFSLAVAVNF